MNNKKMLVIGFIMGAIVFGTIGVYASTFLSSSQVSYNNTNVQDAVDDLYSKSTYGNATSDDLLTGKTALVDGKPVLGGIETIDATTYTPGINSQIIGAGKFLKGDQTIGAVTAKKILTSTNGTNVDMGGAYRYVDTTAVYAAGKADCKSSINASDFTINTSSVSSTLSCTAGAGGNKTCSVLSGNYDLETFLNVSIPIKSTSCSVDGCSGYVGSTKVTVEFISDDGTTLVSKESTSKSSATITINRFDINSSYLHGQAHFKITIKVSNSNSPTYNHTKKTQDGTLSYISVS